MTLIVQLITANVFAQTDAEYEAALLAIQDNGNYYITTDVEGIKYYLDQGGYLTDDKSSASIFNLKKKSGGSGSLKSYGFQVIKDGSYFSNPVNGSYDNDSITDTHLNTSTRGDATWETQVFFLNDEGKYAIRACNCSYAASGWNHVGSSFWTTIGDIATYEYDPQYIWELEEPADVEKILAVLNSIYEKYNDQVWDSGDGESMNIGTGPGQHSDFDAWQEFYMLIQQVDEYVTLYGDPDYDPSSDPDIITYEEAQEMGTLADSLYQKILDSEVPYTLFDTEGNGYYRIIAHNRYKSTIDPSGFVDKAIAASYDKDHVNRIVYSTLDRSKAHFLWKLTQSEDGDSILMQNAGMNTYVSIASRTEGSLVTTADETQAGYVIFDYAYDGPQYVEPDGIGEDKDIICIRFAQDPRKGEKYFHQNGHGSVNDTSSPWGNYSTDSGQEQNMAFWRRTWDYGTERSDFNTSEWFLEYVPEDEAEQLIADFEMILNHDVLVAKNNELRAQVLETLTLAKDVIRTKLITSASQMSSPYSHNDQAGNGRDGGDLSAGVLSPEGQHYIELTGMENMVDDCEFYLRERAGAANDRPKQFLLLGTDNLKNADEDWVEMATIDIPNFAAGAESTVPFNVETAYPYVRVVGVDCDPSYRTFWHAAELQIFTVRDNPNSQFAQLGEVAETLDETYNANIATADEDITPEIYQALLDAYNDFINSGLVDPAELRAALATYANATAGVVQGSEPGQWMDDGIADSYNNLYSEADAYDKAGKYDAAQVHKYSIMLKAMQKSVMEKANGITTDKWYRIMYPTEEMFDVYGFSKAGGDNCNDLTREEQHTMYGTFVVPAKLNTEQGIGYDDEGNEITTTDTWVEGIFGEDSRESDRLFFMAEDEIDDKDFSMFRFVESEPVAVDYTSLFSKVKENMNMALDLNLYTQGEPLITDAAQLSSNASDKSEGLHIEYLVDGSTNTYWHSDYHKEVLAPGYIQVALNEPTSGLIQVYMARRSGATNGHVTRMFVQGSTDAETWSNVGYIELPFVDYNTPATSQPIDLDGTYSYLRFTMTNRYGSDGGGIEYNPFEVITSADQYSVAGGWSYFHASEFQIYPVTVKGQLSASAQALQDAYTAANKVLLKDATAEDITAAAQAYRSFRTEFNTAEGMDVLPYGEDKAQPVYALQNKATGLFVFVDGTGSQNNIYLKTIPSLVTWKALGYQRSLLGVSNLKGESQNYLHAGESNRRFCTWSTPEPTTNSGLVVCEANVEYEAPAEFTFVKNVKPGRIIDWCHSVSLTAVDAPDDASAYTVVGQYTEGGEGEEAETFLALKAVETIEAGQPALFIYGDTTSYDAEDEYVEPIKFKVPGNGELAIKGTTENGLIGTLVRLTLEPGWIYFNANYVADVKTANSLAVTPCSAVLDISLCPVIDPYDEFDFCISLGKVAADAVDGVKDVTSAVDKISQKGNVYSMDGRLLKTGATLNSLKTLGKGMYILNGVKVLVK